MSEPPRPGPAARQSTGGGGDLGRRIALRRAQLGLSREEVAVRAGSSPGYVRYLEESTADPSAGTLLRIAAALETTTAALHGCGTDLPPGLGRAGHHPQLLELDPTECRARLATHGVGRISVSTPRGPVIFPVNYSVIDDAVVFRTAPDAAMAAAAGAEAAFEVDHIDEALSQGWSVLVVGRARQVTEPAAIRELADKAFTAPWPGGSRDLWLRIEPTSITGRRIQVD
ncbi:pyridoxamine 5'-phosphate oxidase family protein [Streptomyces sp. 4503]|uniref:Pyridoxamine 5'-phosphate oxidase family protein n=1 Tax=Streptomyces niphimycinicus TaxID=2842201 RepID=A0ABS6CU37_9ACTN|nr:pyridoxamine 5'-phosphate oxidase family protein [Streptomyces niphimycinicus]MBU3870370.1 pyridoxamine 5'-phosphate oxidase family protein [Streptomyces niphimycinicus]